MQLEKESIVILRQALEIMEQGFCDLPQLESKYDYAKIAEIINQTALKLQDNYPYFHPFYAGQMLKPPHPVARIAYMLAMWINPNNHALDGGRASSKMEKQAVSEIAKMFGWDNHLGHLTSGGTFANLEALWIGSQVIGNKKIAAAQQSHYTHQRLSKVLGLDFVSIKSNDLGCMDMLDLECHLKRGGIGMVVATVGTTGTGSVDDLDAIIKLRAKYNFRIHVDAAYGGYFKLVQNLSANTLQKYKLIKQADSIVVDPHKHGLQPYGCGCILFKDVSEGSFYKHDSPYTYFTSDELHLGEISLECSRAGAAAVALWATQKLLPLEVGGEFALGLEDCHEAALAFYNKLFDDDQFLTVFEPELDIVIWAYKGESASQISLKSEEVFHKASAKGLHLATFKYPALNLKNVWPNIEFDQEHVILLRSCLMKPEHKAWLERIWQILLNL